MTPVSSPSLPEHWRGRSSPALVSLAGLLALAPLVFLPGLVDFSRLPQPAFVQAAVLAVWLLRLFERRPLRAWSSPWRSLDAPILVFLAVSALSTHGSVDPGAGLPLLLHWGCCALVYLLVSRTLDAESDAAGLILGLLAGAGVVALVGIAQAAGGLQVVPQAVSPSSTMANRNVTAGYLVMVAPLALVAWHRGGRPGRLTAMAALAALAVYLPFSLSRLAAVAVAVQLLVLTVVVARGALGVRSPAPRRLAFARATAGLVGVLGLAVGVAWLSSHDPAKRRSLEIRAALARTSVEMLAENPLSGVGLGNFAVHQPRVGPAVRSSPGAAALAVESPHSEPLQVLAETGVGGGLALAWLGLAALAAVLRLRRAPGVGVRRLALGVGLALVGLALDGLGGFPLRTPMAPLVGATLLGLLAACEARRPVPASEPHPPLGLHRRLAAVALVGLLLLSGAWSLARLSVDRTTFLVRQARSVPHAIALGQEAVRASSPDPALAIALARAHLRIGQPLAAAALLEAVRPGRPWDTTLLGTLGAARMGAGEAGEAARLFAAVLALDPLDARARQALEVAAPRDLTPPPCPPGVVIVARPGDSVDVTADAVPLSDVLACLGARAGIEVEFDGPAPEGPVSVTLRDEPLETAVDSLFEGLAIDYLLTFDPDGTRVERLIVVSPSGSSVRPGAPSSRRRPPRPGPQDPGGVDPVEPVGPGGDQPEGEWLEGTGEEGFVEGLEPEYGADPSLEDPELPEFPDPPELSPMTLRLVPGAVSPAGAGSRGV